MTLAVLPAIEERVDAKNRGAFFTPSGIATYLASWAVGDVADSRVLDPTCGDGVFLIAAAERLRSLGVPPERQEEQVYGMDLDSPSLVAARSQLESGGLGARLLHGNFFHQDPPGTLVPTLPEFDAVLGNPPFIRYHQHAGAIRKTAAETALRQGVRLSGLASSWAAVLVHASAFLKPEGRLAMVMPSELLSVSYAEPVRAWLRRRFGSVKLVMFERLQFASALEDVVLLVAEGSGGCDAFSMFYTRGADDLPKLRAMDSWAVALSDDRKWTNLLLSVAARRRFEVVSSAGFVPLGTYGSVALGTVTGSNAYFTLSESTRIAYELRENEHVVRVFPPSSRHHRGITFTTKSWETLRNAGERVWLLHPTPEAAGRGFANYLSEGIAAGVPDAYKCRARRDWRTPPLVSPPDLFFTYMSHRFPRLIANRARVSFLNSMHGVRLDDRYKKLGSALPLVALNSVTMLGAELFGRSYGGGVLKMEPTEAARLPLPSPALTEKAWSILKTEKEKLERLLVAGLWTTVVARVDEVLLRDCLDLPAKEAQEISAAALVLRSRRMDRQR